MCGDNQATKNALLASHHHVFIFWKIQKIVKYFVVLLNYTVLIHVLHHMKDYNSTQSAQIFTKDNKYETTRIQGYMQI